MDYLQIFDTIKGNVLYLTLFTLGLAAISYLFAQLIFVRVGRLIIRRSANKSDDIIFKHLNLKRLALIAPFAVIWAMASLFPEPAVRIIQVVSKLVITWFMALGLVSLVAGINAAYEKRESYNGVSIKGYMDIIKLIVVLVAIIISISIFTQKSAIGLLTGLGAVMTVIILIFQNTILSLVASVQIMTNDLLKEGDFIEVPSFHASGTVISINLHTIRVRNSDMTYSHIPTYKVLDTSFVNWRGMEESESRRIKRAINLDQTSIRLWDAKLQRQLTAEPMLADFTASEMNKEDNGPSTNSSVFRDYVLFYLRSRQDIYQEDKTLLVRLLAPDPYGIPLELIAFTRTIVWNEYEQIQSEIFEHLLAVLGVFGLKVSQASTRIASGIK